jgi:hypothetical protein
MKESSNNSDTVNKAALDHARAMAIQAADIRMKNFNFFLIIMGAIMAAFVNVGRENARLVLGAVGVLVSLAFLLLEIRGRELLDAAQKELTLRESELGISIRTTLLQRRTGKFMKKAISHSFVYRAIYVLGIVLSFMLVIASKIYTAAP